MNVYEDETEQETALRDDLDVELGALMPGLVPAEAIAAQGQAIRRRRQRIWSLVASFVALVALGSTLLLPGVLRNTTPPALTTPSGDWISVNSAAYDEAHGLLGSGTVAGKAWSISLSHPPLSTTFPDGTIEKLNPDDDNRFTGTVAGSKSVNTDTSTYKAPQPNLLENVFWIGDEATNNPPYQFGFGPVVQKAGSVLVHYANGESISFPATEFEGKRYIAILDVTTTTIDKLTVYGTDGTELGYVEPSSIDRSAPDTVDAPWYTPDQVPVYAPAAITFTGTEFDAPGTPWTIEVQAGGFGICENTTSSEHFGGAGCTPPGSPAEKDPLSGLELGDGNPAVLVLGPLNPAIARVVVTLTDGETAQMQFKTIDGKGMAAEVFAPGKVIGSMTAYTKDGSVYAHQTWGQPAG